MSLDLLHSQLSFLSYLFVFILIYLADVEILNILPLISARAKLNIDDHHFTGEYDIEGNYLSPLGAEMHRMLMTTICTPKPLAKEENHLNDYLTAPTKEG